MLKIMRHIHAHYIYITDAVYGKKGVIKYKSFCCEFDFFPFPGHQAIGKFSKVFANERHEASINASPFIVNLKTKVGLKTQNHPSTHIKMIMLLRQVKKIRSYKVIVRN